jgi:hypothetical protein
MHDRFVERISALPRLPDTYLANPLIPLYGWPAIYSEGRALMRSELSGQAPSRQPSRAIVDVNAGRGEVVNAHWLQARSLAGGERAASIMGIIESLKDREYRVE